MSDQIKDLNIELLVGLKQHLDGADRLRALLNRMIELATPTSTELSRRVARKGQGRTEGIRG